MMLGAAPKRAAICGMRVPKASMPSAQAADTIPMVRLSAPSRSSASGTSGNATPTCRPIAAQAAKTGSKFRQGLAVSALLGDTEVPFRAEGRRLLDLDLGPGCVHGGSLLLAAPHVGIEAVLGQQLAMPTALGDAAAVEHHDLVGMDDGRQAMGDHHGGAAAAHLFQRVLDLLLGARVERAGRLVEQEDARVLEDR